MRGWQRPNWPEGGPGYVTFPIAGGTGRPEQPTFATRPCPTCNGTGINPILITRVCPRCHGERKVLRR